MSAGGATLLAIPGIWFQAHQDPDPEASRPWFWPTWWMLAPALLMVLGVVIMLWPGGKDGSDDDPPRPPGARDTFNVASYGQQGGTTAGQVYGIRADVTQRSGSD
jgi:hypothetical protein